MSRARLPYGVRGKLRGVASGSRSLAPTFGKEKRLVFSMKTGGQGVVEVPAERLAAQIFMVSPEVIEYKAQPFVVDLIDRRIYRDEADVKEARKRHKGRLGPKLYFPDFEARVSQAARLVAEVKLEGFLGDEEYQEKLSRAAAVLGAHGYEFKRLVIPYNPRHPLYANLALLALAQKRKYLWPTSEQVEAIGAACGPSGTTVAHLCETLGQSADLVPVWLVSGAIRADLAVNAINGFLHVQASHGDLTHLSLLQGVAR